MYKPERTVAPHPFLSLLQAKEHLRVTHSDDDVQITALVQAAIDHVDGWTGVLGRCVNRQTWRTYLEGWCDTPLPFPDLQSATVKYLNASQFELTLAAGSYDIRAQTDAVWIFFKRDAALPELSGEPRPVWIDGVYGIDPLPEALKTAVKLLVAHWYDNREGREDVPPAVQALLRPFKVAHL